MKISAKCNTLIGYIWPISCHRLKMADNLADKHSRENLRTYNEQKGRERVSLTDAPSRLNEVCRGSIDFEGKRSSGDTLMDPISPLISKAKSFEGVEQEPRPPIFTRLHKKPTGSFVSIKTPSFSLKENTNSGHEFDRFIVLYRSVSLHYHHQSSFDLVNLLTSQISNGYLGFSTQLATKAEVEVRRLDQLKASRMKEIALKKQVELEEIYAHAHVAIDVEAAQKRIMALIDSGTVEPSELLTDMDTQIAKAKEEALSRKDILDRVEKWMSACEEESWLEDYSRDDNRYSASRAAHINLKRAEKARILVNKIPGMVETLVAKTRAWEQLRATSFTYDGVPLLVMLDEYALLMHYREEEKKKMRDQKKFHEQLATEQETLFGIKPTPSKSMSTKKVAGAPRGNGVNGTPRRLSMNTNHQQSGTKGKSRPMAPVNYVALPKDDVASQWRFSNGKITDGINFSSLLI
ncbi:hypothetical protein ACHQM5_014942 [Ranunculus cassubicifolius]